jgi:hypothetical protein
MSLNMVELKVRKIGNSLGVALLKEAACRRKKAIASSWSKARTGTPAHAV